MKNWSMKISLERKTRKVERKRMKIIKEWVSGIHAMCLVKHSLGAISL